MFVQSMLVCCRTKQSYMDFIQNTDLRETKDLDRCIRVFGEINMVAIVREAL